MLPKMLLLALLPVLLTTAHSCGHEFKTALKFGANNESYVLMTADLSPAREEITVCSWVRRMSDHRSSWQYWLSYATKNNGYELCLSDVGEFYFLQDLTYNNSPHRHTIDEWHHICTTWGFADHTTHIYYDGELVGTKSTWTDRKLFSPGSLMLGQFHVGYGGKKIEEDAYFGGELHDLNIYSRELTDSEVRDICAKGRCSSYSKTFGGDRFLRGEDFLQQKRHGNVTEVLLDCPSVWDVLYNEKFFEREISRNLIEDLDKLKNFLQEFEGHKMDTKLIEHLKKYHEIEADY